MDHTEEKLIVLEVWGEQKDGLNAGQAFTFCSVVIALYIAHGADSIDYGL